VLLGIAFAHHSERAQWLMYLCSAVDAEALGDELFHAFVDDDLAERFNAVAVRHPGRRLVQDAPTGGVAQAQAACHRVHRPGEQAALGRRQAGGVCAPVSAVCVCA
jgi:hypothetical protein